MSVNTIKPGKQAPPGTLAVNDQTVPADYNQFWGKSNYDKSDRFHIDNLRMNLRDLARPNMFMCRCIPPSPIRTSDKYTNSSKNSGFSLIEDEFVTDLVKSTNIPSVEIGKIQISRMGNEIWVPGDSKFGDLSVTFYNDADLNVRSFFHQWHIMYVNNYYEGVSSYYPLAMDGTVIIEQLDNNFNVTYAIECRHAWPTTIGEIALSHETENSREEFQVTFAYSNYKIWTPKQG